MIVISDTTPRRRGCRMGLTIYYDWKTKADLPTARRMIVKFHRIAQKLAFDEVSEVYEQDPPDGKTTFLLYEPGFRQGGLYRSRACGRRSRGRTHRGASWVFFNARVTGGETAQIGLASHPPVVVHREDVIKRNQTVRNADARSPRAVRSSTRPVDADIIPGSRRVRRNMRAIPG